MKDHMRCGSRPSLEPGLDLPGHVGTTVLTEDGVGHGGVSVFGVDQETVDVEDAGTDGWEATAGLNKSQR